MHALQDATLELLRCKAIRRYSTSPLGNPYLTDYNSMIPTVARVVKGHQLQPHDVYIGRECTRGGFSLSESKWANPFPLRGRPPGITLFAYEEYLASRPNLLGALHELHGKRLLCWCAPKPCHGHILQQYIARRLSDDPWECEFEANDPVDWDSSELPEETHHVVTSKKAVPLWKECAGKQVEATIIGRTHMKDVKRCLSALTAEGRLFRPTFNIQPTAQHPLSTLYTTFRFIPGKPSSLVLPHANEDVFVENYELTGRSTHVQVLNALAKRDENAAFNSCDSALPLALQHSFKSKYVLAYQDVPSTCIVKPQGDVNLFYDNKRIFGSFAHRGQAFTLPVSSAALRLMFGNKDKYYSSLMSCIQ